MIKVGVENVFRIDRNANGSMTLQLVENVRGAIVCGQFREGDVLPTIKETAGLSGACEMVVREAYRRLSDEGLVRSRPRIGCVVCPRPVKAWRGHVLLVTSEMNDTYFVAAEAGLLRERLTRAGYFVTSTFVLKRPDGPDYTQLDEALSHPLSLVIVLSSRWGIPERVAASGVRTITAGLGLQGRERRRNDLDIDAEAAFPEVIARCRELGIRRVLHVGMCANRFFPAHLFREAGLEVGFLKVTGVRKSPTLEAVEMGAIRTVERAFGRSGRDWLPDLLYASDDYVARGVLTALAHHGVELPEDLRFLTLANQGNGPCHYKSLARVVLDPLALGETVADRALRLLAGRKVGRETVLRTQYVPGETF